MYVALPSNTYNINVQRFLELGVLLCRPWAALHTSLACVQRHATISAYKSQRKAVPKKFERDISAENFLKALSGPLRRITYQHLALLYNEMPDHPLCLHPLTDPDAEHHEDWLRFVKEVVEAEARNNQLLEAVE